MDSSIATSRDTLLYIINKKEREVEGMNLFDTIMCSITDAVVSSGASLFAWGEPEVSEALMSGYEEKEEE